MVHLNLNKSDWEWDWVETPVEIGESKYFVATATYIKVVKPGELTEISLSQIALDPSATNENVKAFGDTFQVLVKSQGIQAEGFTDADTALNEGFGEITSENIPWKNDSPIRGIDLRTALHNLNGDTAKNITAKVSNVIYALNEEYPWVLEGYEGTPVDIEQDVPVYAYYVPNGGNYDVYFLADDTIYSPKDSSTLYMNMTALETVDTHNYDVSRVETMYAMFARGRELDTIDLTHWDTSKVTNMRNMFYECNSITELNLSFFDMSNATITYSMFQSSEKLKTIYVGDGWDLSNATSHYDMFYACYSLVGGNGTAYDDTIRDKAYGHVDTAENPGYLTYKAAE